jgi:hypothetical protein
MFRNLKRTAFVIVLAATATCHAGTYSTVDPSASLTHRINPRETTTPGATSLQGALPLLQDGDLIFITTNGPIFRHVSETTGSWETHVGILFHDGRKGWLVAESVLPVSKFTPLERFVSRSTRQRFLVSRLRTGLTDEGRAGLYRSAALRMGKSYTLGFNYDSRRLYCSKFVHDVYAEALGCEVGQLETFREIIQANPNAPLKFWKFWFLGHIPWERRCITTTSVLRSENFRTVFDSEVVH